MKIIDVVLTEETNKWMVRVNQSCHCQFPNTEERINGEPQGKILAKAAAFDLYLTYTTEGFKNVTIVP